jgi:hypothetical protein
MEWKHHQSRPEKLAHRDLIALKQSQHLGDDALVEKMLQGSNPTNKEDIRRIVKAKRVRCSARAKLQTVLATATKYVRRLRADVWTCTYCLQASRNRATLVHALVAQVAQIARLPQVTSIPHQDNYHDCGLFTLVYMEFFCFDTPRQVHCVDGAEAGRRFNNLLKDFGPERQPQPDSPDPHPTFLTPQWFDHANAGNLRFSLMVELIEKMRARACAAFEAMEPGVPNPLGQQIQDSERFEQEYRGRLKRSCAHAPCYCAVPDPAPV